MSIAEDLNSYLMQGYAGSLKEVLKQTMLSQEFIFREQVQELHRLHRMQNSLMKHSVWKELNGYHLWEMSTQSTLGPFINPTRYSPHVEDKSFYSSPMLESAPSVHNGFLREYKGDYSRLQQRPFDVQLPGDQFVNHVGKDLLQKRDGWDLRKIKESNHQFYDDLSSPEDVKLTLSFGGDTKKEGGNKSTWYDKITHSTSHPVIDLEESANMVSDNNSKYISTRSCAAAITDKCYLRVLVESNHVSRKTSLKKDLSSGPVLSCSPVDSEGRDSFNQGFEERHGDIAHNDIRTPLTCSKAFELDLNIVQVDESSNNSVVASACLSMDGPSGAFEGSIGKLCEDTCPAATNWRKSNINCPDESSTINYPDKSSTILQQDATANPTLMVPDSVNIHSNLWTFTGISQTEACCIDLKSKSGSTSEICEYFNCDRRNNEGRNIDLLSKSPKRNYTDVVITEELTKMHEEYTVLHNPCMHGSRVEDATCGKSPSSCIVDCIADDSSTGTKTMLSGTDFEGSNTSILSQYKKSQSSQSGEQDLRSSDSSELKQQCCNKKQEESTAEDILIQTAAESLIHLSMKSSTSNQDCSTKVGSNGNEDEERDMPQHSIDSYESIVLKLTENNAEDYCVSSKHFEVNEMDKKDFGVKLKRGRRLKDFRRDVLPSLVTLSSHEIREDVSIMQTVIKSREYKRMRSKMANGGGNLSAPIKSRRSRLNYVARRYYS